MPINSKDDLDAALAAGQTWITATSKNAHSVGTQAAGVWYDLSKGAGITPWDALIGSGTNHGNDHADWITTIGVLVTVAILIIWRLL